MTGDDWKVQRLADGSIDYMHYKRVAQAERRAAKHRALRRGLRASRRLRHGVTLLMIGLLAFVAFWNLPPLGSSSRGSFPFQ